jgi:hypothetical protein
MRTGLRASRLGPLLDRRREGFLQHVLGEVEVAQEPDEGGEGARTLLAVQRLEIHGRRPAV